LDHAEQYLLLGFKTLFSLILVYYQHLLLQTNVMARMLSLALVVLNLGIVLGLESQVNSLVLDVDGQVLGL